MNQLAPNVFYLNRYPTFGCVVTREGVVAVDGPMRPTDAAEWRAFLESKGPIRYIIHTEHHQDHIAINGLMPGTVVAGRLTDADFFKSIPSNEVAVERMRKYDPGGAGLLDGYRLRAPEIVYDGSFTLRLGGETFHLRHSPGHTRGQTLVHAAEARVAFTGDNITPGNYPFFHSAAVWAWFDSLRYLESLEVDWYVPGHGDPCRKEEIARQRAKMEEIVGEVRRLKRMGKSRGEVQEEARYIHRPGLDYPRVLGPRAFELEAAGLGVVYDALDERP